jgi:hypothetical protein
MCSQPRHVLHGILTGIALGNACSCHGMLRAPDRHTAVSVRATIQARRREVVVACVIWARNFVIRIGVAQVNLSHERAGGAQPGAAARWHTRPLDLAHPKRSRSVPSSSRRSSTTQMMSSLPASQRQRTAADRRVHTTTTHHPSAASSAHHAARVAAQTRGGRRMPAGGGPSHHEPHQHALCLSASLLQRRVQRRLHSRPQPERVCKA